MRADPATTRRMADWRDRRRWLRDAPGRPIYFWHIPKTAGSSFQHHLLDWFPERHQCHWGDWDTLLLKGRDEIPHFELFRGHFGAALEERLGHPTHRITFLRDPVARTVSHYRHVRRQPEHPYHARVREQDLAAFLADAECAHMIDDFQARSLVPRERPIAELERGLDRAALERFALQTRFERAPLARPERLREDALDALGGFVFVGVAEQFQRSLRLFAALFDRPRTTAAIRTNVARPDERAAVPRELVDEIRARTRIDRELHEHAWQALAADGRRLRESTTRPAASAAASLC